MKNTLFTLLLALLLTPLNAQDGPPDPTVYVVDSFEVITINAAQTWDLAPATAYEVSQDGRVAFGGWTARPLTFEMKPGMVVDVGHFYDSSIGGVGDTTRIAATFNYWEQDLNGYIPIVYPDSAVEIYMVRDAIKVPDSDTIIIGLPVDSPIVSDSNLLQGWNYIQYESTGTFSNSADTLLTAHTTYVPGIYTHTPQIVSDGWATEKGDTLYAKFQVRGTNVERFRLDVNTGPDGDPQWAFHLSDTFPVTQEWVWHSVMFEAQYTDPDNRFDFNIGIDTGVVQFRHVSLSHARTSIPDPQPDLGEEGNDCDTVYLEVPPDTIIELVEVEVIKEVILRDTTYIEALPDTITEIIYFMPEFYPVTDNSGKPVSLEIRFNQYFLEP